MQHTGPLRIKTILMQWNLNDILNLLAWYNCVFLKKKHASEGNRDVSIIGTLAWTDVYKGKKGTLNANSWEQKLKMIPTHKSSEGC